MYHPFSLWVDSLDIKSVTTQAPKSCKTGSMQFMLRPMNFHLPTDEDIHTAFAQGEAAVMVLFHDVAAQVTELAQQLAQQGALLHELQARLAKTSRNSSKPPASDGYGKMKRTESLRKSGDKPTGQTPPTLGLRQLGVKRTGFLELFS